MEEKTDSKNPKISDTNIRTISPEELIHMVNSTDNEEDFKEQYPNATFSRKQAKYWVEKNCHLSYASGLFLPPGCNRTEVYEILAEHAKGSKTVAEKASKKGPLKDADQQVVICKLSDPTTKKSKTFSAKTLARWDAFLNKLGVKRHLIHYYNTAALELFMQMLSNGKVKIRFTDEVSENE